MFGYPKTNAMRQQKASEFQMRITLGLLCTRMRYNGSETKAPLTLAVIFGKMLALPNSNHYIK